MLDDIREATMIMPTVIRLSYKHSKMGVFGDSVILIPLQSQCQKTDKIKTTTAEPIQTRTTELMSWELEIGIQILNAKSNSCL